MGKHIVHCLYYHTVHGKPILDYFDAHGAKAWDWKGNMAW